MIQIDQIAAEEVTIEEEHIETPRAKVNFAFLNEADPVLVTEFVDIDP